MSNPFASTSADFGSLIFGGSADSSAPASQDETKGNDASSVLSHTSQESDPVAALWHPLETKDVESHYIDTAPETLAASSSSKSKLTQLSKKMGSLDLDASQDSKQPHKGGRAAPGKGKEAATGNDGWSGEGYEVMKLSGVEEVFLAFQERLESSGAQDQLVRSVEKSIPLEDWS